MIKIISCGILCSICSAQGEIIVFILVSVSVVYVEDTLSQGIYEECQRFDNPLTLVWFYFLRMLEDCRQSYSQDPSLNDFPSKDAINNSSLCCRRTQRTWLWVGGGVVEKTVWQSLGAWLHCGCMNYDTTKG